LYKTGQKDTSMLFPTGILAYCGLENSSASANNVKNKFLKAAGYYEHHGR
jgi:hypothetical protein